MNSIRLSVAVLVLAFGTGATLGAEPALPEICGYPPAPAAMDHSMAMGESMDAPHVALMSGMADMDRNMDAGMKAPDIDVAFVCGMIPHHQGAIAMAQAELEYGDSDWAKEMARAVIDAQTAEIAAMIAWLDEQPK